MDMEEYIALSKELSRINRISPKDENERIARLRRLDEIEARIKETESEMKKQKVVRLY